MIFEAISLGLSFFSRRKARKEQRRANREAIQVQRDQLEFIKKQYEDWKEIYGPLQEDLSEFYQNLTGETISSSKTIQLQKQYQQASKALQESAAQRGLDTSALGMRQEEELAYRYAEAKAEAKVQGELQAAQAKGNFLAAGQGRQTVLTNQMGNVGTNLSTLISNQGAISAKHTLGLAQDIGGFLGYAGRIWQDSKMSNTNNILDEF